MFRGRPENLKVVSEGALSVDQQNLTTAHTYHSVDLVGQNEDGQAKTSEPKHNVLASINNLTKTMSGETDNL